MESGDTYATTGNLKAMDPTSFYLLSLGCAKNRVDSEVILGGLISAGYHPEDDPLKAQLIVVNTCSFIESAVQESIDTILALAEARKKGACRLLVVTGCLPQRYGKKLAEAMPEVDLLLGTGTFHRLPLLLDRRQPGDPQEIHLDPPRFLMEAETPRVLSGPCYSAYLKVAEGCSNRCAFCTIPAIRGSYRSRPLDDLLREADRLALQGVRELNLVAQDTTAYGEDLGPTPRLADLLDTLARTGLFSWIRILYAYPQRITGRLLEVMGTHPSICPYLDIPFQHASERVLRAMGRSGSPTEFLRLVQWIRAELPTVTLRTTLMVGYPGETDDDFQELYELVDEVRFQRLGIFAYSAEQGTAAARLGDSVPKRVKTRRLRKLAALQEKISLAYHRQLIGTTQPVLVEGRSPETKLLLQGRLASQAPEVDGRVLISSGFGRVGEIMPVRLTEAHPHDLVGEIVKSELL
jgi:ribosomal protein S12 methylthiotransferase